MSGLEILELQGQSHAEGDPAHLAPAELAAAKTPFANRGGFLLGLASDKGIAGMAAQAKLGIALAAAKPFRRRQHLEGFERDRDKERRMSTTLGKGLKLLEALCFAREPLGITDLSRSIDMNISAVQRLLGTLVRLGYVEQVVSSKKYRATLLTWEIGAQLISDNVLRRALHPVLRHAAHSSGYTSYFILNNAPFVTYFDKVEGPRGLTYSTELGTSIPIGATAAGMAIIAFLDPDAYARLSQPADRHAVLFPGLDLSALAEKIDDARHRRYATSESGYRKGVNSVAAPVWGGNGNVCGSIAITADENELRSEKFVAVGADVVRWAEEATLVLGGAPYPRSFYK